MPILTEDERIGTQLGERYALKGILGRGGMGVVYDAEHTYTGRRVAVKLLRPEVSEDPKRAERLTREARAAAALDHPGIVDVLDMGEVDGCLYLALEHLDGRDLEAELSERGTLGASEAVDVVVAVLDALAVAHAAGIVHRDIKPSNVFLARRGGEVIPKVLDFGIARSTEADGMTTTGTLVGTPWYMSPEAAAGDEELGPDVDVWAAAVVLYECLSGKRPFEGKSATGVLMNVLRKDAEPLVLEDAPAVARVVNRALSKGKGRIRDAAELARELRDAVRSDDVASPARGRRRAWIAAGVVASLLVAGGLGWVMEDQPEAPLEVGAQPVSANAASTDSTPTPTAEPAASTEPTIEAPEPSDVSGSAEVLDEVARPSAMSSTRASSSAVPSGEPSRRDVTVPDAGPASSSRPALPTRSGEVPAETTRGRPGDPELRTTW